ncbi:MAG TPA: S8 family peptidase, partial [Pyrinomonadaceae bacterium]|nr:S8 family peptidase [Pyrinomonadaceae bacterium]
MAKIKRKSSGILTGIALLSLLLPLCMTASVGANPSSAASQQPTQSRGGKVSTDLAARVRETGGDELATVILQLNAQPSGQLNALLQRAGVRVKGHFSSFNAKAVELPLRLIDELASFDEVESITPDRQVESKGHVTSTTGAELIRKLPALKGNGTLNVDGTGIGIAVLDSGIYADHLALTDASGGKRTTFTKDFTGENRTDDPYGHGTHVASAAAGNDRTTGQTAIYTGIAPNATLVSLRVLDSQGRGSVSSVLSALDWVMKSGSRYKIRVVNMSLGAPAIDSYRVDPLCKAVRSLFNAGIVVVAAAGNDGKDDKDHKIYGRIHSPGNEPSAITVGATNTFGTDVRSDDVIATYSSRGPTRSFYTDESGVRRYDNIIKPDLVAPGNKIIYAESLNNYLVTSYPSLDAGRGGDTKRMMYMSGTSVSSPVVAGTVALMLQVNPNLTPNLIKMILMYTAQPLAGANMLEQGAGQLNIEGAVRLAQIVRTDLKATTPLGAALLVTKTAPTPQTTIAGYSFPWAQGIVFDYGYATGVNLITKYQKVYGTGILFSDG